MRGDSFHPGRGDTLVAISIHVHQLTCGTGNAGPAVHVPERFTGSRVPCARSARFGSSWSFHEDATARSPPRPPGAHVDVRSWTCRTRVGTWVGRARHNPKCAHTSLCRPYPLSLSPVHVHQSSVHHLPRSLHCLWIHFSHALPHLRDAPSVLCVWYTLCTNLHMCVSAHVYPDRACLANCNRTSCFWHLSQRQTGP